MRRETGEDDDEGGEEDNSRETQTKLGPLPQTCSDVPDLWLRFVELLKQVFGYLQSNRHKLL